MKTSDIRKIVNESIKKSLNEMMKRYTHFAVNKANGKIVNGWDYTGIEQGELNQYKKDYFIDDLVDMGANPMEYKILTAKGCLRQGINPNDNNSWMNLDI